MSDKIVTADLSRFGYRELGLARDLLNALMEQGVPKDFDDAGLQIAFNTYSGYVFLTNEDYQVAMLNEDNKLEAWESCPICGHEAFRSQIEHESSDTKYAKECRAWVKDVQHAYSEGA